MTYKVFIDTNIIIDIWLKRESFFENAQKVILKIAEKNYIPHISGSSVTDLYYICKKGGMDKEVLRQNLKELMEIFEILIIDKESINNAISSDIKDFEDAVQIMACKKEKIDLILTRNKKDFKNEWIEIQTPPEFLVSTSKEEGLKSDYDEIDT